MEHWVYRVEFNCSAGLQVEFNCIPGQGEAYIYAQP